MERLVINSDIIPTEENNFTIKTKNGIILRDLKKFIIDNNLVDNFKFLELFYDSRIDKIRIVKIERNQEDTYPKFLTEISNSEFGYLFDFEN
tara:strand:+ start:2467 stop:2742 length:276 start_codon:yes stop_codon:yes gene_type:complete